MVEHVKVPQIKPEHEPDTVGMPTVLDQNVETPNLSYASMVKVITAATKLGLIIEIQATRTLEPAVLYVASGKGHSAGDVRKPAHERENVQITVRGAKFAVSAIWGDGDFLSALVGGPASGYRPPRLLKGSTVMMQEIARCAEADIEMRTEA